MYAIRSYYDDKPQQSDEAELGITYKALDDYLTGAAVDAKTEASIEERYLRSEHKRQIRITSYNVCYTKLLRHNLEGTNGRELYGALEEVYQLNKASENVYWMDKTRYSAFTGTDLELQLRARGITELHLVGVCTDICVLHTAVDAYNRGFHIVIHEAAVASFDQEGHVWALRHFKGSLGAEIQ